MAEAGVGALPTRVGTNRADHRAETTEWGAHNLAQKAGNRERVGLVAELRCECGRPNCTETVPAVAEAHRGMGGRLVVVPAHFNDGMVVRAADRFFVVEAGREVR
jgi:hypothetical protein